MSPEMSLDLDKVTIQTVDQWVSQYKESNVCEGDYPLFVYRILLTESILSLSQLKALYSRLYSSASKPLEVTNKDRKTPFAIACVWMLDPTDPTDD